jgi:butyrate kinase
MAVFNTARLRDILVRGRVAAPEPASEFVDELEDPLSETLSGYSTIDRMALMEANILRAIAESEARQARHTNQAISIVLAGIALAVGIILGFG